MALLLDKIMKKLNQLILESNIDIDNLLYKVEFWFDGAVTENQILFKEVFNALVADYKKRKFINSKYIEGAISNGTINKLEIQCFVNFICDDLNRQCDTQEEINYLFTFKKIIQLVASLDQ